MSGNFDNFAEEIKTVLSQSTKDGNYIYFKVQLGKSINIIYFNDILERCCFDIVQNVDLEILSENGQYINGNSDKFFLSDIISRLYNSLSNLLKANGDHRVQGLIKKESLLKSEPKEIRFNEFTEWDIENLKKLANEIYKEIDSEIKSATHVKLNLDGLYALCHAGSNSEEPYTFDDFILKLNCTLYSIKNSQNKYKFSKSIEYKDLDNLEDLARNIAEELNKYDIS